MSKLNEYVAELKKRGYGSDGIVQALAPVSRKPELFGATEDEVLDVSIVIEDEEIEGERFSGDADRAAIAIAIEFLTGGAVDESDAIRVWRGELPIPEAPLVRQEEQQQAQTATVAERSAPLLCANEHGVELRYCGIVIDGTPPPHAPAHSWPGYDYTLPTPGYWIGKRDHHVHYPGDEVAAAWRDIYGGETIHVKATRQDTRVWLEGEGSEYFGYMPEGFDRLWALTFQEYRHEPRILKKTGSHAARSASPRPHYDSQFWVYLEGELPRELWLAMTSYLEKND